MNQVIVAMSGRKQAGKSTLGKFLCHYVHSVYRKQGKIVPSQYVGTDLPCCYECSFADNLKEFCIDTLGLRHEACYGTDDEKRAPTRYCWEDAPKVIRWKFADVRAKQLVATGKSQDFLMDAFYNAKLSRATQRLERSEPALQKGPMSGRDIMQIFGTDLVRQTFGNVWAEATIRRIKRIGKLFSVITDNRFPNEIKAVLSEPKGYVIRLTRSPFGTKDVHPSESALDDFDWNREKCFVLDNADMTLNEQSEAILPIVDQILDGVIL
jgi:hypothetical protein